MLRPGTPALPQAMAGALTPFPDRAGTAASLVGLVQQTALTRNWRLA